MPIPFSTKISVGEAIKVGTGNGMTTTVNVSVTMQLPSIVADTTYSFVTCGVIVMVEVVWPVFRENVGIPQADGVYIQIGIHSCDSRKLQVSNLHLHGIMLGATVFESYGK